MIRLSISIVISLLVLSACSDRFERQGKFDIQSVKEGPGSLKEKAEVLARAGEQFALTHNFMVGARVFDIALGMDAKNERARAYKAILAPLMEMKGILKRIQPLVRSIPKTDQESFQKVIDRIEVADLKAFLLDGSEDIRSEADFQNFVRGLRDRFREGRVAIGELRNHVITLRPMMLVKGKSMDQAARNCQLTSSGDVLFYTECDMYSPKSVKMEFPDWDALRFSLVGLQMYFTLWNAYDVTGAIDLWNAALPQPGLTPESLMKLIHQHQKLGLLNDVQALKEAASMGIEAAEAMRSIATQKDLLCSNLKYPESFLRGGYIGHFTPCVPDEFVDGSIQLMNFLTRTSQVVHNVYSQYRGQRWLAGRRKAEVNLPAFLGGSIPDLKAQLPSRFDRCGHPVALPDETLGGVFPAGDASKVIRGTRPDFLRKPCEDVAR